MKLTVDIVKHPLPQAPEGMPEATIHSINLADSSDLLCGVLRIGNFDLAFERGYMDAPNLIEDPSCPDGSGEVLEYPDWDEFLTMGFNVSGDTSGYGQYINDLIDAISSRAYSVMIQALEQASAEILA